MRPIANVYYRYGQQVDPSQVSNSNVYSNSQQGNATYPQQQQYNHPPAGPYQAGQGNPYSKTYSQSGQQHYNLPPRQ